MAKRELEEQDPWFRPRVYHPSGGESMVKQADASQTDINVIVAKFTQQGFAIGTDKVPVYGDFTGMTDYHEALSRVREAEADFMLLPAHIRAAVDNDPGKFLDLVFDPNRVQECRELGLLAAEAAEVLPEGSAAAKASEDAGHNDGT